ATAGGADKIAKARELGADEVIDHYDENIVQRVRQLTTNRGVDVVVEHVGAATWEKSLKCLARGGRRHCSSVAGSRPWWTRRSLSPTRRARRRHSSHPGTSERSF